VAVLLRLAVSTAQTCAEGPLPRSCRLGRPAPGVRRPDRARGPVTTTAPPSFRGSVVQFEVRAVLVPVVGGALDGVPDLLLGLVAAHPGGALHRLARLQVLVDGEEVLDLQPLEL